jgi:hypothetical protein
VNPLLAISPLPGLCIRSDGAGSPLFGSTRTNADGSAKWHYGLDLAGEVGCHVVAPMAGLVVRWGWCYAGDQHYRLVELYVEGWHVEMLYLRPMIESGRHVEVGTWLGELLDVSQRYPGSGMTPHLHLQVWRATDNPAAEWSSIATAEHRGRLWYDPAPLLGLT